MSASEPIGHGMNPAQREGDALPGRPVPRPGGRRQRQDARRSRRRSPTCCASAATWAATSSALTFTQGRARDGRAREDAGRPQAVARTCTISTFHSLGVKLPARRSARTRAASRSSPSWTRDDAAGHHPGAAGATTDKGACARCRSIISAVEKRAAGSRTAASRVGIHARRGRSRQRLPQLRRHAGGLPGGGLRRPHPHSRPNCLASNAEVRTRLANRVPLPAWWTNTRTPTCASTGWCNC